MVHCAIIIIIIIIVTLFTDTAVGSNNEEVKPTSTKF